MRIDLFKPDFSQREVAEATTADMKTLDNYIQHGHVEPNRDGGRRLFSAFQMIEIEVIARLADLFKIPPKTGKAIAREIIVSAEPGFLESEAAKVGDEAWVKKASKRAQVTIRKSADGNAEVVLAGDETTIDLVFPLQLIARSVLFNASLALAKRGGEA